jgi:hypothetical protein
MNREICMKRSLSKEIELIVEKLVYLIEFIEGIVKEICQTFSYLELQGHIIFKSQNFNGYKLVVFNILNLDGQYTNQMLKYLVELLFKFISIFSR